MMASFFCMLMVPAVNPLLQSQSWEIPCTYRIAVDARENLLKTARGMCMNTGHR